MEQGQPMNLKTILVNRKSSAGGLALILGAIGGLLTAYANDSLNDETIGLALAALVAGYNGLVSRDADVSSEKSGAK